jgi:hypothetical protein
MLVIQEPLVDRVLRNPEVRRVVVSAALDLLSILMREALTPDERPRRRRLGG